MTVYPLTFPSVGIVNSSFRYCTIVGESTSIYTAASQLYLHQGEWFEGELTFKPMNHAQVGEVKAFLAALRGKYGTFLYGDPDYLAKGANGSLGGSPVVAGGSQTGNTLDIDGCPNSVTFLKKGDYFQLGTGLNARMYLMTEDAVTNGSGETTLNFVPRLRSSPLDNATVIVAQPKTLMRLVDNSAEWQANQSSIYNISIPIKEALSI